MTHTEQPATRGLKDFDPAEFRGINPADLVRGTRAVYMGGKGPSAARPVLDTDAPFAPKGADVSRPIPPVPQGMNLARIAFDYDRWQWVESWNQAARDEARAARNRAHWTAAQAQRVQS